MILGLSYILSKNNIINIPKNIDRIMSYIFSISGFIILLMFANILLQIIIYF